MSFYGQVFYELTNAFASVFIKSKITDTELIGLEAQGTGGKITFVPGNAWIELDADKKNYICSINHAELDANRSKTTVEPFQKVSAAAGTSTALKAGDTVAVPTFQYDAAGHIVKTDKIKYFTLPINETETNIQDLQDRMQTLEAAEDTQNNRLKTLEDTFDNHTNSIEDLDSRVIELETLPERVVDLETAADNTANLLGNRADMTEDENLTVSKIIGDFDNNITALKYDSVTDGISSLAQSVNAANSSISNNALAVRVAIKNLCDILNAYGITDQDGNPIDSNKLWNI